MTLLTFEVTVQTTNNKGPNQREKVYTVKAENAEAAEAAVVKLVAEKNESARKNYRSLPMKPLTWEVVSVAQKLD